MSEHTIELNDNNFKEKVIEASKSEIVVVDFWAPWCGPCQMLGPVIDEVAKEFEDDVVIGKVNVDDNPSVAQEFGIMSIPAVKLFKDGKVVDEFMGALPKDAIVEWLKNHL